MKVPSIFIQSTMFIHEEKYVKRKSILIWLSGSSTCDYNGCVYVAVCLILHLFLHPLSHATPPLDTKAACLWHGRAEDDLTVLPLWCMAAFIPTLIPQWIITHNIRVTYFYLSMYSILPGPLPAFSESYRLCRSSFLLQLPLSFHTAHS